MKQLGISEVNAEFNRLRALAARNPTEAARQARELKEKLPARAPFGDYSHKLSQMIKSLG